MNEITMTEGAQPLTVKALFTFKGSNNDELNFSKGDIVTITQKVDGGWWEGTLNGTTGWFPSNYVKEIKPECLPGNANHKNEDKIRDSQLHYRNVVLQSLIDSERNFVTELQNFLITYLRPLHGANILSPTEYSHLLGNMEEIVSLHQSFLTSLDECAKLQVHQQRIGGIFMKGAPQVKLLYEAYCANHPQAAAVIAKKKEDLSSYMESKGATSPGHMILTTGLSEPFTRLEKYPNMLKELERHTEESHVDRGDTQRAISFYKEISSSCNDIRREKEIEYEILNSTINGWEGEEISKLGEVKLMSHVKVFSAGGERKEQIFMVFSNTLVMLLVSPRRSNYTYEGKLPLSSLVVNNIQDSEEYTHALEISGSMTDKRIVCCPNAIEKKKLHDGLRLVIGQTSSVHSTQPKSLNVTRSQPSITTVSQARNAKVANHLPANPFKGVWSMSCLRPAPPIRPSLFTRDGTKGSPAPSRKTWGSRRKPVDDCRTLEDDAQLLKVIESYCTSAKTRHTVNSSIFEPPQVIIPGEEKIIVEETQGDQVIVEEKSLVDVVYTLRDTVNEIRSDQKKMKKDLEEEKKARRRLENMIRKSLRSLAESSWEETG